MEKPHKIWRVTIADATDWTSGNIQSLPIRGEYLIESRFKNGLPTIQRRAISLAKEDGIILPVVVMCEWINGQYTRAPEPDIDAADWWKS